jgi:hypothetical protein
MGILKGSAFKESARPYSPLEGESKYEVLWRGGINRFNITPPQNQRF